MGKGLKLETKSRCSLEDFVWMKQYKSRDLDLDF